MFPQKKLGITYASKYLSMSVKRIRELCDKGSLEHFKTPDGYYYFTKEQLDSVFTKVPAQTVN